jgi:amino acid transporter
MQRREFGEMTVTDMPSKTALSRSLNPLQLILLILSSTTPMAAVVGLMPLSFAFGASTGVPLTFVIATIVLLFFSVGYTTIARSIRGAGSFYAFIASGFGASAGVGAALLAVLSYLMFYCGSLAYLGFFSAQLMTDSIGLEIPWPAFVAIWLVIIGWLGRRQIDLNSRVVGVIVLAEFAIIMVLNAAIVWQKGTVAFTPEALNWHALDSQGAGISLMLAFTCYIGFEAAALFSEETRNPERSVPLATYGAVLLIGGFFGLTSWLTIGAVGPAEIQHVAEVGLGQMYFDLAGQFVGTALAKLMEVCVVTSLFATILAGHNVCSRYLFILGRDGVLPAKLAGVHPRFASPYRASLVVSSIGVVVLAVCAAVGLDPIAEIGAPVIGCGTVGLIGLQALLCLAVILYFVKTKRVQWWRTMLAPFCAFAGLSVVLILALAHFELITGSENVWVTRLPIVLMLAFAAGLVLSRLQAHRPPH